MVCSNCGTENRDNSEFCMNCGMSLASQRTQQPQQSQQSQQTQQSQQGQQTQQTQQNQQGQYSNQYAGQTQYNQGGFAGGYAQNPVYSDPYNHSGEFDKTDVSQNKVFAMLPYLMGWIGVIVALIASRESKYVGFHVRQALKLSVTKTLLGIIALVLCWTVIVPIVAGVMFVILWVVQIISFFSVCSGNAVEPPIVRGLGFLK